MIHVKFYQQKYFYKNLDKSMSGKVTLGYWNIRGLGERVRLLLEYLQIPYDEKIFTPETRPEWFDQIKP